MKPTLASIEKNEEIFVYFSDYFLLTYNIIFTIYMYV